MRENGLRALHGYRTRRWEVGKPAVLTPNLLKRQFSPTRPNAAWATNIMYIRTWQGWLYLAVVIDLSSRKVVGWAAGPTIHRELVLNALASAAKQRRPRGTIIHSGLWVQFGSDGRRRLCSANHLELIMSRKGNCWDNAVVESFFSSLKKERIKKRRYPTRDVALADIADYIDTFYNRTRRHSHLGGVSPEQFEWNHKRGRRRVSA
jgi:putative transposase